MAAATQGMAGWEGESALVARNWFSEDAPACPGHVPGPVPRPCVDGCRTSMPSKDGDSKRQAERNDQGVGFD
jgi:hypothetical protein